MSIKHLECDMPELLLSMSLTDHNMSNFMQSKHDYAVKTHIARCVVFLRNDNVRNTL